MIKTKVKITDKDNGYKRLAAELGGMGTITLGVQGAEAEKMHPSGAPVGQIAAAHELGLVPGAPQRSWLRSWMDSNEQRMLAEVQAQYKLVMQGKKTRNKALKELGYKWVEELRQNIDDRGITPPLAASTVKAKGHNIPLLDTGTLRNSITYKVFLKMKKSARDAAERAVLFRK